MILNILNVVSAVAIAFTSIMLLVYIFRIILPDILEDSKKRKEEQNEN